MALDFNFTPELAAFAHMTVVPGITIGDLVFASAQKLYSTGLSSAIATANTLPANQAVDLFKVGRGTIGQGFTASLTISETNMDDDNGRFGANECFIAYGASFRVCRRTGQALASTENLLPLPPEMMNNIIYSCSWTLETADGIKRNMGLLAGYPAAAGAYGLPTLPSFASTDNAAPPRGGSNGAPRRSNVRLLPVPVVFAPQCSTRIQVVSGTGVTITTGAVYEGQTANTTSFDGATPATALATTDFVSFLLNFHGYRFTMPVAGA